MRIVNRSFFLGTFAVKPLRQLSTLVDQLENLFINAFEIRVEPPITAGTGGSSSLLVARFLADDFETGFFLVVDAFFAALRTVVFFFVVRFFAIESGPVNRR